VRVEVLAVGTELLLGQIANTNGAWLGEQLALVGVDSHFQQVVGDNQGRIVLALRTALARGDGVVVTGGLGPTHDDITREAIAEVMGAELRFDPEVWARIEAIFAARGRALPESNRRQAMVPEGARVIEQRLGTAPGLICPVGLKVVYALPGVPYELQEMFERAVVPDLRERLAAEGFHGVIRSRVLRTWGISESALAERVAPRIEALDAAGNPTIAFQASGIEGIKVRVTAKAASDEEALALLDQEEAALRDLLGDAVFGLDECTMEQAVAEELRRRGLSLGLAESVTGGLVAARLVAVPGASQWFRGSLVTYATETKVRLLGVPPGPVVSPEAAEAMAVGARRALGADVGLALTGVAGPEGAEDQPPGTVFVGLALPDGQTSATRLRLPGDRDRVRQLSVISALDYLRRRLRQDRVGSSA
jgi:nicotinamide-nucleotide amidase